MGLTSSCRLDQGGRPPHVFVARLGEWRERERERPCCGRSTFRHRIPALALRRRLSFSPRQRLSKHGTASFLSSSLRSGWRSSGILRRSTWKTQGDFTTTSSRRWDSSAAVAGIKWELHRLGLSVHPKSQLCEISSHGQHSKCTLAELLNVDVFFCPQGETEEPNRAVAKIVMEMAEEMEQKEVSESLPEALVEKIIAMMPFPFIFKARVLSKSWRDKFTPILPSGNGADKFLAASAFQRQVCQWSMNWKTFSPVFLEEDLVAYDGAAQNWRSLPSMLSFLRRGPVVSNLLRLIEGPLLYGFAELEDVPHVVVANLLTGSWRMLPPRPSALGTPFLVLKLVLYPSLQKYKVIVFCEKRGPNYSPDHYCAQIYDSKSGAWSSKDFRVSASFACGPHAAAYLNGVLYMVGVTTPHHLLAFNVEEETLEELRLSFDDDESLRTASLNLVICNANWLMIATKGWYQQDLYRDTIQVFRIDLGLLRLSRLACGPPAALNLGSIPFLPPAGDGNCLFFLKVEQHGSRVVAYNVDEDVWSSFPVPAPGRTYPWTESTFRPGLSPFMPV